MQCPYITTNTPTSTLLFCPLHPSQPGSRTRGKYQSVSEEQNLSLRDEEARHQDGYIFFHDVVDSLFAGRLWVDFSFLHAGCFWCMGVRKGTHWSKHQMFCWDCVQPKWLFSLSSLWLWVLTPSVSSPFSLFLSIPVFTWLAGLPSSGQDRNCTRPCLLHFHKVRGICESFYDFLQWLSIRSLHFAFIPDYQWEKVVIRSHNV